MEKILTVVVPSYNAEAYLREDIPTFLDERILKDLEILIVNDGSKDGTSETGHKFQQSYPETVRVIDKENGGHGSTINAGIREATGKYFKVVDADDWVDTESLVHLVQYLKDHDSDLVLSPFYYVNDGTREKEEGLPLKDEEWKQIRAGENIPAERLLSRMQDTLQMHCVTFRTEILKAHGITLDENRFYVDQEYILYPVPFLQTVSFFPEFVYQYRIATEGQSMNWKNMIKNRNMHGEVLLSLIHYYEGQKAQLSEAQKEFFIYRCAKMLNTQASIYLMMKHCGEAKKEMKKFEEGIRRDYLEIYQYPYSRKIVLLRKMGYVGFRWISAYAKKVNR